MGKQFGISVFNNMRFKPYRMYKIYGITFNNDKKEDIGAGFLLGVFLTCNILNAHGKQLFPLLRSFACGDVNVFLCVRWWRRRAYHEFAAFNVRNVARGRKTCRRVAKSPRSVFQFVRSFLRHLSWKIPQKSSEFLTGQSPTANVGSWQCQFPCTIGRLNCSSTLVTQNVISRIIRRKQYCIKKKIWKEYERFRKTK